VKYQGSKNRHYKELLSLISKDRTTGQYYVEPFCGSCSVICNVEAPCIANDNHYYLICMWKALQGGWVPPRHITEEQYNKIKKDANESPKAYSLPYLVGYVGFNSYGGKWFGGYPRDKTGKRDYWDEYYRNIMKQVPKIKNIQFYNVDYKELQIPENSIIYCDPPYLFCQSIIYGAQAFSLDRLWESIKKAKNKGVQIILSIDGKKKSGKLDLNINIPSDLFERELLIDCGSSMIRRFQKKGLNMAGEQVHERLLLSW